MRVSKIQMFVSQTIAFWTPVSQIIYVVDFIAAFVEQGYCKAVCQAEENADPKSRAPEVGTYSKIDSKCKKTYQIKLKTYPNASNKRIRNVCSKSLGVSKTRAHPNFNRSWAHIFQNVFDRMWQIMYACNALLQIAFHTFCAVVECVDTARKPSLLFHLICKSLPIDEQAAIHNYMPTPTLIHTCTSHTYTHVLWLGLAKCMQTSAHIHTYAHPCTYIHIKTHLTHLHIYTHIDTHTDTQTDTCTCPDASRMHTHLHKIFLHT